LEEVVISDGVESIGEWAFANTEGMTKIIIPASVKYIGICALGYEQQSAIGEPVLYATSRQSRSTYYAGTRTASSTVGVCTLSYTQQSTTSEPVLYATSRKSSKTYYATTLAAIDEEGWGVKENFEIWGYSGTAAETYAKENNIKFVAMSTCASGHTWDAGKVTTAATCTKTGVKTYTCSVCGETKTEEIAATGHSFDYTKGTVTKASTSTQTGTVVYPCANCDDTLTQVIPVNKYPDVTDTNQYYYVPALWAASEGLIQGMDDGSFNPSGDATRAQMITILWRAAGEPEPTSTVNPFTDVVDTEYTHWYYKAVLWGVEKGIIHGMTATTFEPNTVCSRAMILTMLYRAEGEPDAGDNNPFVDVKDTASTNWYYDAVLWAAENGVANGMDATHFVPATECARAAMVTFLYRNAMR
jgi:hypothetical protein